MFSRKNRQNEIEIQLEDVELIMGEDFPRLHVFLESTFCPVCSGYTSIEKYIIYLDDRHDIIFDGSCCRCHEKVARYVETGESKRKAAIAKHIRDIKKTFLIQKPNQK